MKKPTGKLDMTFHPRHDPANSSGSIMDAQDNVNRGDGAAAARVMTTFQMDAALKAELRKYCDANGLKLGGAINRAVEQWLAENQ